MNQKQVFMKVDNGTENLSEPFLGRALGHFEAWFGVESFEKLFTATELLRTANFLDSNYWFLLLSHFVQLDCIPIAYFTCMYMLQYVYLFYMVDR